MRLRTIRTGQRNANAAPRAAAAAAARNPTDVTRFRRGADLIPAANRNIRRGATSPAKEPNALARPPPRGCEAWADACDVWPPAALAEASGVEVEVEVSERGVSGFGLRV
jgi:hypothetical protein